MASRLNNLHAIIKKLESKVWNLEASIINFETQVNLKKVELIKLNKEIERNTLSLVEIKEDISIKLKQNIKLKESNTKYTTNISRQEQEIIDNKGIIIWINKEIDTKNSLLERVIIEINWLNLRREDIELEIEPIINGINNLQKLATEIGQEVISKEKELYKVNENLQKIQKEYTDIKEEYVSLDWKIADINMREKNLVIKEKRYKKIRFNQ